MFLTNNQTKFSVKLCGSSVNSVLNKKLGNKVMIFYVSYWY